MYSGGMSSTPENPVVDRPRISDGFVTPRQVAELLRVSYQTLYMWRRENINLPYYKLGGGARPRIRYRKHDVLNYLATMRNEVYVVDPWENPPE